MPTRAYPIARLRAYPRGAEGYVTDPGWAWYSAMAAEYGQWYGQGGYQWGAGPGAPMLAEFENITLGNQSVVLPRPLPNWQHTESAQWTQDAGEWEEHSVAQGFAWTALYCRDDTGQLASVFSHPADPCFLFAAFPYAPSLGSDPLTDPPGISFYWGTAAGSDVQYELRIWWDGEIELYTHDAGATTTLQGRVNVDWRWPRMGEDNSGWLTVMVAHLCGGVAIKLGERREWEFFAGASGDLHAAAGSFVFGYQGSPMNFQLHSVLGPLPGAILVSEVGSTALTLTSEVRTADRTRAGDPTVEGRYLVPAPAAPDVAPTLTLSAVSHAGTDQVEAQAVFEWGYTQVVGGGQADNAMAYSFPHFPELYAVQLRFDPTCAAPDPGQVPVEIWADQIETIDTVSCEEVESQRCNLDAWWLVDYHGAVADWLNGARLDLAIGWRMDDASTSILTVFTGYADNLGFSQAEPNKVRLTGSLVDVTTGLRACECEATWPVMDGWNSDDAALYACQKYGWAAANVDFSALTFPLSEGLPEEPLWQARPGQSAWEFLERIARYNGCELTVTAAGGLVARAIAYVDTGTITTIPALSLLDPGVTVKRRNLWGYTGVEVRGRTVDGEELVAIRYDPLSESDPTYAFYKGYRRLEQFCEPGLVTQADVDDLADILYASLRFRIGDEVTARIAGNTGINRRQALFLTGLSSGIADADRHATMSIAHHWGPRKPDCYTEIVAVPYPV